MAAVALPALVLAACDRPGDVREWTRQDHDHTGAPNAGQVDTSRPNASPLGEHGVSDVVLATWKQNCVTCHGVIGRGDGPQGPMVKPPDFTHPVWQKNAFDDNMRRTINKGRGAMPAFAHLPEETVTGLIQLIRLLNRERAAAPAAAEAPAAAPPAGAPPPSAPPPAAAPSASAPPTTAVAPPASAPPTAPPPNHP